MKIDLSKYFKGEIFALKERVKVNSLNEGANLYGGATQIGNEIFSNTNEQTIFDANESYNTIGIIIPGTIDVNKEIDNTEHVNKVLETLEYFGIASKIQNIQGSWKANDGQIVIEKNKLITWSLLSEGIHFNLKLVEALAKQIKEDMKQEGVSITLNEGLIII